MNSRRNPSFLLLVLSLAFSLTFFAPQARADDLPHCEGLGLATSFNAFVFENWSATSSDVEGRIAVGGNLSINHYSLGDKLDPATAGVSVIVGGDFTFPSGRLYYGNALIGGSAAGVGAAVRHGLSPEQSITDHAELPFDFDQVRDQAVARSQTIAELSANGTWISQWGGLYLTGAPDAALQVFELPAQLVWNAHTFDVQQIPPGATVVFNLRGASAGLTNMSLQSLASIRRRVLFNFPDATSLTLAGIGVEGSILAPLASIQNPQGVIKGNLVARSWSGMMQLNHEPFEGCGLPGGAGTENRPPEIVSVPPALITEDAIYTYDVDAVDPDDDALHYAIDRQPSPATIDPVSGLLHWPASADFVGSTRARNTMCRLPSGPGLFDPEVVWTWNGPPGQAQHGGVYGPVLVGQFTDDNGDGSIDASDRPDIVAMSRSSNQRHLNLIDGTTGTTHWSIRVDDIAAYGTPAIGDINGDGRMEIVAQFGDSGQQVGAYDVTGQELWRASVPSRSVISGGYRDAIVLADLEGDGSVEVVRGRTIIESNGQVRCSGAGDSGGTSNYGWSPVVADIDLDGVQEIIAGRSVYHPDCSIKMQLDAAADGFAAIGNFDGDDEAEIVLVSNGSSSATGRLYLFDHDGRRIFGPVSFPGGGVLGPPTLANVDDDAFPEIGIAGRANYALFDHTGTLLWSQQVQDTSSSQTGSTSFDFEADGKAEIVYSDELNLRVFDGATGAVRMILPNISGTTLEYPVIVDADGDGSADILIGANDGGNGIRMISSATRSWAPTRSLWNQHAYHVDNINDDGSIPRSPKRSWLTHNTFRLNAFPSQHALGQPDLALFDLRLDESDGTAVKVLAVNRGLAPTREPTLVQVFNGLPGEGGSLLGVLNVPPLAAGEELTLKLADLSPESIHDDLFARLDETTGIVECDYSNNTARAAYFQVRASDPHGLFDTQRFTITVENVNAAPSILTTALPAAQINEPYRFQIQASDPDRGDGLRFELVSGPAGMAMDPVSGELRWTPNGQQGGMHDVVLRVVDLGGLSDERTWSIDVPVNHPPRIVSTPLTAAETGTSYNYQVEATDPDGDALSFTLLNAPLGMSIEGTTGLIVWTPGAGQTGAHAIRVQVSDGRGGEDVQTFELVVTQPLPNRPPQIVSTPPASVDEGAQYVYDVDAVDPDGDVLGYSLDAAPETASLHSISARMEWQAGSAFVQNIRGRNDACRLPTPATGPLMPTVMWHWNQQKVLSIPLVGPFFDTNGDGRHDALDRTTIAVLSHTGFVDSSGATLRFLDGETGAQISQIPGVSARASAHAAFGDINNDGAPEIVLYLTNGNVAAVRPSGEVLWTNRSITNTDSYNYSAIGIEDIDGDGIPEILARNRVLNADGTLRWTAQFAVWHRVSSFAVDLDGDGRQEVIIGGYVYDADGNLLWQLPSNASPANALAAVGNFDDDPEPEIVFVVNNTVRLYESSGTLTWGPVAIPGGGGGSPVVADLDGDGYAEIGVAGTSRYVVFDQDGSMIWSNVTQDSSRTTGSTVFDFDGDGRAEIVYGDEQYLRVYDGRSGNVIYQIVNRSATASEYPLVADIDGDGQAEILVLSDTSTSAGIRALRSASTAWVGTRSLWNQYNYRIDNVADDTSVPPHPEPSWLTHNSFRLNAFPDRHSLGLPDLALFDLRLDESHGTAVKLTVVNRGLAPTPVPTQVRIFNGNPQSDGEILGNLTVPALAAGQALELVLDVGEPAMIDSDLHAHIDEGDAVAECLENNNRTSAAYFQARASDPDGLYDTQRFTVTVENVNQAPSIQTTELPPATIGEDYRFIVAAHDPDLGDGLLFKLTQAPTGLDIEAVSGELRWLPESAQSGTHALEIQVVDLGGLNDTRTFTLSVVADNRNPRFLSVPPTSAQVSIAYSYDLVATDPDGDDLTYRLISAPEGMSISPAGAIAWTPTSSQVGSHPVEARVEDGHGGFADQRWSVTVLPTPNRPPAIVSVPPATIGVGQRYRYAAEATDADGDTLTWSLSQSPAGMTIDPATGLIEWTPDAPGSVPVRVRASDGMAWVEQGWTLTVRDADVELGGSITITPQSVAPGGSITVTVIIEGAAGPVTLTATLDGDPIPLAPNATTTLTAPTAPGTHTLVVQISDGYDHTEVTQTFSVIDPNDTTPPVVQIATPQPAANADLAILTAPTQIIGTVSDANLSAWRLALVERGAPPGEFITLATGNTNVLAAALGNIDPTLLLNGLYTLVLDAWDHGGHHAQASVPLSIEGDMKLGHFSIGFADLSVPVSGLPITLTRTYDTRQRHRKQDFGQGWRLDHSSVRLQESRTPGYGWQLNTYPSGPLGLIPNYCVESALGNVVSVTLPDGKVEKFKVKASPACNQGAPFLDVNLVFEPMQNTHGRLETRQPIGGRLNAGSITHMDDDVGAIVDPDQYRYIDAQGREYSLDQGWGLRQIHEREAGNTITFQYDGIVHSNGTRVDYARDAEGRITTITAPDGTGLHYEYDANGDLVAFEDAEGNRTTFTYLQNHYLQDIIDPRGVRVSRNEYDDAGRLVAVIDANGNRIQYTRDIAGRVEQVQDRNGHTTTYVYNDRGDVLAETNAEGETILRAYDEFGNKLSETDPLGNTEHWTYDNIGNVRSHTNAKGETTTTTYGSFNHLIRQTDAAGNVVMENTYNNITLPGTGMEMYPGPMVSMKDANGAVTHFGYDPATGELNRLTDASGAVTRFEYDAKGYKTAEVDALGHRTEYVSDDMGRVLTQTRTRSLPDGSTQTLVTTYTYDANGNVIATEHPDGSLTTTDYDGNGKPIAECDALNRCVATEYDERGNIATITYPDGTEETKSYDPNGNLLAETDRAGRTTRHVYDNANRQIATLHPDDTPDDDSDNPRRLSVYDAAGRLQESIDENGHITRYGYDGTGRRTHDYAPDPSTGQPGTTPVAITTYDAAGRRASVTDALGRVTRHVYDPAGRLTDVIHPDDTPNDDSDNPRTRTEYDAAGRKTAEIDEQGRRTAFGYDAAGRLIEVRLAAGTAEQTVTTYGYDEQGNKTHQTDAEGRITRWEYDAMGRETARILPNGARETKAYNAAGELIEHTDFNGQTTKYEYDTAGRLTKIDYPTDADVTYGYNAAGERIATIDGRGTSTNTYDARGRITRAQDADGGVIEYDYDAASNLIARISPSQSQVYQYDARSRLIAATRTVDGEAPSTTAYEYADTGSRTAMTTGDGTRTEYQYDARNRLRQMLKKTASGVLLLAMNYSVDASGLRTGIEESDTTGGVRTVQYHYDGLKRLTRETIDHRDDTNDREATWTYDTVGNRLTQIQTVNGATETTAYAYDVNDRLLIETTATDTTTYTYDANGNTLTKTGSTDSVTYAYDNANRLQQATTATAQTAYAYTADGLRIRQVHASLVQPQPATTTWYVQDTAYPYAQVIEEYQSEGTGQKQLTATYTFGDELTAQTRYEGPTPQTHYVQQDGFGSTRWLTNQAGTITDSIDYDAFGNQTGRTGSTEIEHLYRGERFDANIGFYDLRARLYNPLNGRFLTQDSFVGFNSDPRSLHKYAYTHADPVNNIDPSGHMNLLDVSIGVRLWATQLAVAAAPALYTIQHVATRLGSSQLAMLISRTSSSLSSAVYRSVGLHPNLLRLNAGQMFEKLVSPAMRLIGATPQYQIRVGGTVAARADWLWQGRYVIDAKLGQHINLSQLGHFVTFAARQGGSVTYVTLTRTPPSIVNEAIRIGQAQGVPVNFIPLLPL